MTDTELLAAYYDLQALVRDQRSVGVLDGSREHRLDAMRQEMCNREYSQLVRNYNS